MTDPDPSHRGDVTAYIREHEDGLPPVFAPENGYTVSDAEIWPGDVLASENHVHLVVDVTDHYAICYLVGEQRYTLYDDRYIPQHLDSDRLHCHREIIEPPKTPVR